MTILHVELVLSQVLDDTNRAQVLDREAIADSLAHFGGAEIRNVPLRHQDDVVTMRIEHLIGEYDVVQLCTLSLHADHDKVVHNVLDLPIQGQYAGTLSNSALTSLSAHTPGILKDANISPPHSSAILTVIEELLMHGSVDYDNRCTHWAGRSCCSC